MSVFWPVFYVLSASALTFGFLVYAWNQIRATFFLPPARGKLLHVEKYRLVRSDKSVFDNRAHLLITDEEMVIGICRMFYKYWPGDVSTFVLRWGEIDVAERVDGSPFNVRLRLKGNRTRKEWLLSVENSTEFLKHLYPLDAAPAKRIEFPNL